MDESAMIEKLWHLVRESPDDGHYLRMDEGESSEDYCHACAQMKLAEVVVDQWLSFINGERAEQPWEQSAYIVSMTGGWPESDGCKHCDRCGMLLGYSLTDYGVEAELEHFESTRFRKPIDAEDAFHVVAILEQTRCSDDENVRKAGLRLGARALRRFPAMNTLNS